MFPAVAEDEETGEPVDVDADDEEYGLVIMKAIVENGEELLSTPDSDEELDTVYNLFMERFFPVFRPGSHFLNGTPPHTVGRRPPGPPLRWIGSWKRQSGVEATHLPFVQVLNGLTRPERGI